MDRRVGGEVGEIHVPTSDVPSSSWFFLPALVLSLDPGFILYIDEVFSALL